MFRQLVALSVTAVCAAPVAASTYSAKPVVPTTERIIGRDISWTCGPAACQGTSEESRPAVLCQALAKRAGRIESFVVDGRPFDTAQLAKCNSAAKARPNSTLGVQ